MVRVIRSLSSREREGLALLSTHGVADTASTLLAASVVGHGAEGNPLVATLLADGYGFAAGVMLAVVGAVAVAYPTVAEWADLPAWFAWLLAVIGALVAATNLLVVGVAL